MATPRVYMYNTTLALDGTSCLDVRRGKDLFERKMQKLFQSGASSRVANPAEADLFYHPACLTDLFWQARQNAGAGEQFARRIESQVLAEIAHLGFSMRPHIINAERCYEECRGGGYSKDAIGRCTGLRKPDGPAWAFGATYYPTLWGSERFLRFCSEAPRPLDTGTSAYLPYCPYGPTATAPFRPDRPLRALFVGSATRGRKRLLAAAARTPGVRLRLLSTRQHNLSRRADLVALMEDSVYTLCPSGDTPESQRIYQAIQRGSVPLVTDRFEFPFAPHVDWLSFSAPLCVQTDGTLGLPSAAEQQLLQASVHAHRAAFDCEPGNPTFLDFVASSLRVFAGWAPKPLRQVRPRQRPRPPPATAAMALANGAPPAAALLRTRGRGGAAGAQHLHLLGDLGGAPEAETNENWRACPQRV